MSILQPDDYYTHLATSTHFGHFSYFKGYRLHSYDPLSSYSRHTQDWFDSRTEFWEILITSQNISSSSFSSSNLQFNYRKRKTVRFSMFWYSPPLAGGWRFLYRIQHEQKQHSIMVIMMTAVTTPNITPNNNGSLQQWRNTVAALKSIFRSLLQASVRHQGFSLACRIKFIFLSSTSTANDFRKNATIKISPQNIYPVVPFFYLIS